MPVFSHLKNSMNQMMVWVPLSVNVCESTELYKREYHPRKKLFLKCVSCSVESQTANGSLWLCYKGRSGNHQQILNVEDLVDNHYLGGGIVCQSRISSKSRWISWRH